MKTQDGSVMPQCQGYATKGRATKNWELPSKGSHFELYRTWYPPPLVPARRISVMRAICIRLAVNKMLQSLSIKRNFL